MILLTIKCILTLGKYSERNTLVNINFEAHQFQREADETGFDNKNCFL